MEPSSALRGGLAQDRPGQAGRPARAVDPDLGRGVGVHLAAGRGQRGGRARVALGHDHDPGSTARTLQPSVGNSSSGTGIVSIPSSPRSSHRPTGRSGRKDDREVVGDRRDDRQEVDQLGGPLPVREVEDPDVALDDRVELAGALGVGAQRPADAQQVGPEPERVATLDRARRLDPGQRRHAALVEPGLGEQLLALAVGLARPERDRAPVGHQERVELVDEVRRVALRAELVDRRSEAGQELDEGVVLALGDVEVDRVEEAVGRVVEGAPEGRPRPLDQDVAQRRGHALGAEGEGHGLHPCRIARRTGPDRCSPAGLPTLGAGAEYQAVEDVRVVRSWSSDDLVDRWLAIREAWTQTTFYVFHPESWR